ncbi:MAG: DinB family protein [Planctomycetaceae bacterium]|nr:DinB family protein [Planctomycetaceae bacterium]
MTIDELLADYQQGADRLRSAVVGLSAEQLDATPVPGKWTIRQVVCHIADFETVYSDRMKRVIAEENPGLQAGDPDLFQRALRYDLRHVEEELSLIDIVRRQLLRILRDLDIEDFQRTGVHSVDGPLTLETLLERITSHIPHHLTFVEEKVRALRAAE